MIEPTKNRVLIQRDEAPTETDTGLLIPEEAQKKESTGTIIALGGKADDQLMVGYKVAFGQHDGLEVDSKYCDGLERCLFVADNQIRYVIG